ncbi:beta-galactosidase [Zoogloeaceae bacterium G21618-S1]|nr:beta-galactosidase [Zoogloeaceae bacterium G21618-S1]
MKRRVCKVLASLWFFCAATAFAVPPDISGEVVGREFFGLHIHRADQGTAWPSVPFGSWRLWDAYVNWSNLEPARGRWDFSRLDRYVAMARLTQVDILLPLANTPPWAAARPKEHSGYQPGNASEPANIEDWRQYVRTVGERYKGRIRHYEIWNEPNIKHHFSGSIEKLVELTCEAYQILKSIDAENRVVSPSATAGAKGHVEYLNRFLSAGGRDCIDVVAHHFYVPNTGPEAMVPLIRGVRAVMNKNGVGDLPLWNTETGWWVPNGDGTAAAPYIARGGWKRVDSVADTNNYLLRAFLLARAEGVSRFYWYSWDHTGGLGLIEPKSGQPKAITAQWNRAVDLLVGATAVNCSNEALHWQCTVTDSSGASRQFSWSLGLP